MIAKAAVDGDGHTLADESGRIVGGTFQLLWQQGHAEIGTTKIIDEIILVVFASRELATGRS